MRRPPTWPRDGPRAASAVAKVGRARGKRAGQLDRPANDASVSPRRLVRCGFVARRPSVPRIVPRAFAWEECAVYMRALSDDASGCHVGDLCRHLLTGEAHALDGWRATILRSGACAREPTCGQDCVTIRLQ